MTTIAPPDALTIGYLTGQHFAWIASMPQFNQCSGLKDFKRLIERKNVIGFVARVGPTPVGFGAYELTGDVHAGLGQVVVRELVIAPESRRRGHGAMTLWKLVRLKLDPGRPYLSLTVDERNLDAQRWLRACGVKAVNVARGYFGDRDGITFQLRREF